MPDSDYEKTARVRYKKDMTIELYGMSITRGVVKFHNLGRQTLQSAVSLMLAGSSLLALLALN